MKLGITAIVKNEAPYIKEWLLFHFMQGVTEFFIYNNGSTDDTIKKTIEYPINELKITVIDWPGRCRQLEAYDHSIRINRKSVDWMAFVDIDEFLYSTEYPKVTKHLEIITASDSYNASCVRVPWRIFGSSGHKEYSSELVIERFTHRAINLDPHFKSIIRMKKAVSTWKDIHTFKVKGTTLNRPPGIFINHYHTKSEQEYRARCARGRADVKEYRNPDIDFPAHDINEVKDTYLKDKFAEKIKGIL